ncbi:MAG: hypothetical protein E7361_03565 [Clostridiales bacterium]|nr:hypothetical protein [Clostridiales bacterium]
MKAKQKALVITIVAVLLFAIIGLTIGIVLVAQQASLNNSMTISYTANNVDCIVTTSGALYEGETKVKDITINDTTNTEHSVEFRASDNGTNGVSTKDGATFDNVQLTATGKAVYKFTVKNTATPIAGTTRQLQVKAEVGGISDYANVVAGVGTTMANAVDYRAVHFASIAANATSQNSTEFYVVVKVLDPTLDINNYEMNIKLLISYDMYDTNYTELRSDTAGTWQHNNIGLSVWDGSSVDGNSHIFAVYTEYNNANNANLEFVTLRDFELTGNETVEERVAKIDRTVLIQSAADLVALADYINHSEYTESKPAFRTNDLNANNIVRTTFALGCDIDLGGHEFEPIGSGYGWTGNYRCFSGRFTTTSADFGLEGERTIYNLNIQEENTRLGLSPTSSSQYSAGIGLFGYVRCGVIENININSATVRGGFYTGAIVGYLHNTVAHKNGSGGYTKDWITFEMASVENCTVTNANINACDQNGAGVVCGYTSIATIKDCSVSDSAVMAEKTSYAGAIVGHGVFKTGGSYLKDNANDDYWISTDYLVNNTASNVQVFPIVDKSYIDENGVPLYSGSINYPN